MYWHWQNLNDKPGGRQGSGLLHGRAWFYPWHRRGSDESMGACFSVCWNLFSPSCHARFKVEPHGGDESFSCSFAIPFIIALYFGFEGFKWIDALALWLLPRREGDRRWWEGRECALSVHHATIWWSVWHTADSWESGTPWWQYGCFHFWDFLAGKPKYSSRILSEHAVELAFPEGVYSAKVQLKEAQWVRARWFTQRWCNAEVTLEKPPAVPGKGENSWDCGEDAIYSLSCPAATLEEAMAKYTEAVYNSRRRHGGSVNWKPAELATA